MSKWCEHDVDKNEFCPYCEIKQLVSENSMLKDIIDRAKNYDPFSCRACPLCEYENGKFIKSCNYHKEIHHVENH